MKLLNYIVTKNTNKILVKNVCMGSRLGVLCNRVKINKNKQTLFLLFLATLSLNSYSHSLLTAVIIH